MELNLQTSNTSQEQIKAYLEEHASETLAEKIMSGVRIEKDGKTLVSKKDLTTFWAFATKKARELKAEYVDNDTVYGWAIHYFEEDSIEGKLYNEDGSEYKPAPPPRLNTAPATHYTPPPPKPKPQMSIFDDLLGKQQPTAAATEQPEETEDDGDEIEDTTEEIVNPVIPVPTVQPKKPTSIYDRYLAVQKKYPDCLVAVRLGDFYEFFGEGAVTLANEYDFTLTSRDCGQKERVPMIGIPYHAMDAYVAKFIERHRIAIVEDLKTWDVELRDAEMTVNANTGEVLSENNPVDAPIQEDDENDLDEIDRSAFNLEALAILDGIFGDELDLR